MKRTPLKAQSHKQALLEARWQGMRDYAVWLIEQHPDLAQGRNGRAPDLSPR